MAKYQITHSCGHTSTAQLYGNKRDRQWRIEKLENGICSECFEQQRIEENKKAAEQNALDGLPELTGSEKQILWAEKIRASKLETVRQALAGELQPMHIDAYWGISGWRQEAIKIDDAQIDYAVDLLRQQTRASWYIDHRDTKIGFVLRDLFVANPPSEPTDAEAQTLIDEAKTEATVRPAAPVTETVAEILAGEQSISVLFPEKREDFRQLIKKRGFTWQGDRWKRWLDNTQGTPADRAAEIGHILLGHGYIVRQYNADIREAMIAGRFETEQTRWITLYTSGKESGRLCIKWSRDEDYYRAAKRLPTARYVKPHLSVAVEQFEQALDFAEVNNFSITAAAQAAIDEARRIKQQALVAAIELPAPLPGGDDGKPVKLATPDHVEIADDLRD
jgi:hypothetical protein